jgi:hypothetical protein
MATLVVRTVRTIDLSSLLLFDEVRARPPR